MRIGRLNEHGRERPFAVVDVGVVDHIVGDWSRVDLVTLTVAAKPPADETSRPPRVGSAS